MNDDAFIPVGWEKEIQSRIGRIAAALAHDGIDALLLCDNTNIYYTSGRVFAGYTYITADADVKYFVKRPVGFSALDVNYVHKPELIPDFLSPLPAKIALVFDSISAADFTRLSGVFHNSTIVDASSVMRRVRAVKSPFEIEMLRQSGLHHAGVYNRIPRVYREGMSDIELQVEIERLLRLEGCLGLFRVHGQSMELFMGNILAGDNADVPTPYDFAMGGAGLDLSLPVGADGTIIDPGMTVMVDACGNFNGYMTDMTRCFYVGKLDSTAARAHQLSIDIVHRLASIAHAGVPAKQLYDTALEMVNAQGLSDFFMGHAQHAGFIGHGVGIEVNEAPVLSPRSTEVLEEGNVIAIEPKFVIPHVGAVGVENTYVVRAGGLECLTNLHEQLIQLY
jgi:Xaa-Pro dipeptidase